MPRPVSNSIALDGLELPRGCCYSVPESCPTLPDPMDCSTPGFPVHHQLLEITQTHPPRVGDAIKPSHPLSSPFSSHLQSFPTSWSFPMSRSSHQVAKVLVLQPQHQSLQGIFKVDFLWDWLVWSPFGPRDSQESSPAPQFKSINSSALGLLYGPALTSIHDYWKNHRFDYTDLCQQRDISAFFL